MSDEAGTDSTCSQIRFQADTIARFGSPDLSPEDVSQRLAGGVLAQIAGIRALHGGRVAVLDASFRKVTVFDADGSVSGVLGHGRGEGPGEFMHPTALASFEGRVAVFDYALDRISIFGEEGTLLSTHRVPRSKDVAVSADRLMGTHMPGTAYLAWSMALDSDEDPVGLVPLDDGHFSFYPRGSVARMDRAHDGTIVVAHHRPGLWFEVEKGTVSELKGTELLSGETYVVSQGIPVSPGNSIGIAVLSDELIGIAYTRRRIPARDAPPEVLGHWLAILRRDSGELVDEVELGTGTVSAITRGSDPLEFLVSVYEPYPHVARVVLQEVPDEPSGC